MWIVLQDNLAGGVRKAPGVPDRATDAFPKTNTQLQYRIDCSLSNYAALVERGEWEFPAFDECCPICGGEKCAVRHGSYSRPVIEEDGKQMDIRVMRYKCKRKRKVGAVAHRTFSLLPHRVIPYHRYSAAVVYQTFKHAVNGGTEGALDALQAIFEKLCERSVFFVVLLFQAAFHLLIAGKFVQQTHLWKEAVISLVEDYSGGLPELIVAFYAAEQQFLLGIPSQHRKIKHA